LARRLTRVGDVLGISGGDPAFRDDDGSANPAVAEALVEFAAGRGSEHTVLTALAASRLLVPIVAVLGAEPASAGAPASGAEPAREGTLAGGGRPAETAGAEAAGGTRQPEPLRAAIQGEKASEMAMPSLVGRDGRRAIPAFTSVESLARWQADARPVPVTALGVWQTACGDSAAVVIDVAGPVPFAVEGARLAALATGAEPPPPWADADVQEVVAAILASQLDVASFDLEPPDSDHDLAILLSLTAQALAERTDEDLAQLGGAVVESVMARLGTRLRRGVAIWLNSPPDAS
jgi:SseB protein N-terminal domain